MKAKLFAATIILILVCSLTPPTQQVSASSYEVNYTLTLEQEDRPEVTIKVQGYPNQNASFDLRGSAGDNIPPFQSIFQEIEVFDLSGNNLSWKWKNMGISIENGSNQEFIIRYSIDAINYQLAQSAHSPENKMVLFRNRRIFFIAGDVFLIPDMEPENITVESSLPEESSLYASLPFENGKFRAVRDLWGNLQADFSMAYFTGGHVLFTLNHTTDWGDEYEYVWFDRDPVLLFWTPFYGNTPWEQAKLYMNTAETCASYFRDTIGPLPNHKVLFTSVTHELDNFPSAGTNQDWYHYMQFWPRYSEPDICHHVFHQYSFGISEQSKLSFGFDSYGSILAEGLTTYYGQILPSQFYNNSLYKGKLFEFYSLDARGIPYGIRNNTVYHVQYNLSTLKVYLLDQYIRSVTNGSDSLDGFVKAMWEKVKDNPLPDKINETEIFTAFSDVVGAENANYLNDVSNLSNLTLQEFEDLRSPFTAYADWMSQEYFWDKPILFYMYLDIVSAKGDNWPHYATFPHNINNFRREAFTSVWEYLSTKKGNTFTQQDILDAMNASTGQNHAGFFEFWKSLGITLDPNEIADLSSWDTGNLKLEDLLPVDHMVVGSLRTEHFLAGVPQQAVIHLDTPAMTNQITIEYLYGSKNGYLDSDEVKQIIQGDNVSSKTPLNSKDGEIFKTDVLFKITTDDPNNQNFPITLTYPLNDGVSRFSVNRSASNGQHGELYYLGPVNPISIDLITQENEVFLPETTLEDETYVVSNGNESEQYKPGDKILVSLTSGPIEVQLLDQYGFLRGIQETVPLNETPKVNFTYSDTSTNLEIQFTDNSTDMDGQIISWSWEFGDGQTSTEKNPLHVYEEIGEYTVSLTTTDNYYAADTHTERIQLGSKLQILAHKNGIHVELMLVGAGILLIAGLGIILLPLPKTKISKKSLLIILTVIVILTWVVGLFFEQISSMVGDLIIKMSSSKSDTSELKLDNNPMKISEIDGMTMVFIPEGDFLMGSPEGVGEANENPQHTVNLKSFWIDQTEVSIFMYRKCVEEGVCVEPNDIEYYPNEDFDNSPVTSIDWNQAKTYCEWAGRNLPTEAQWEKAARGPDGLTYPWGEDSPNSSFASFNNKSLGANTAMWSLSPVYGFPDGISPYGLYNMAGNAAEWVADWYGEYQGEPQNDPVGSEIGDYRVVRGGSTVNNSNYIRSAFRNKAKPTSQSSTIGFRCVMPAE